MFLVPVLVLIMYLSWENFTVISAPVAAASEKHIWSKEEAETLMNGIEEEQQPWFRQETDEPLYKKQTCRMFGAINMFLCSTNRILFLQFWPQVGTHILYISTIPVSLT